VAQESAGFYITVMPAPLYNRDILRLAAHIPHLGRIQDADASAERRSAVCGSRVAVQVRLDEEGRVAALGQEVSACALGQASAALMAAHAVGREPMGLALARDELAAFLIGASDAPGNWRGIEVLTVARGYPARHASILLPFEAVAEAAALAAAARLRAAAE
jgi:NifU-like protein involved in Fe-S cluster formation